jgi:acetoacetyl-CoA synthetase
VNYSDRKMPIPIFMPDPSSVAHSQLTAFTRFCETTTGRRFADHQALHRFSTVEFRLFWRLFLNWSGLLNEGDSTRVCAGDDCERAVFFPDLALSYSENLLRIDDRMSGERPALTAVRANGSIERFSRRQLRDKVVRLRAGLQGLGIGPGDRVVAVASNNAEAIIAALAVSSLGATFSAAAPDMGASAVLSRFGQLAPALLFCNLRTINSREPALLARRIGEIAAALPSLRAVVALDDGAAPRTAIPFYRLSELTEQTGDSTAWTRLPFNHPLFILFSSGTTGTPKCIVHGAGGTLLEHIKEHRLHCDLRPSDKLYFHTSCAWMMWNWQLSALATGTEIVVYDGPIGGPDTLWQLVAEEKVTVFGTSPAYLRLCQDAEFVPGRNFEFGALRSILSTGSILHDSQYEWARDNVKPLPLQSISGGTDIIGCFVLGNPNLPVYAGESQSRSLGYDVQAHIPQDAAPGSRVGELICRNPFPSRPLGFYGDAQGRRFHEAYFSQHPSVWTHGDWIEFSDLGTARMHGRSDGVMNVRGIRIGPAEIYRILQDIDEIRDTMAVEQTVPPPGGNRMVLLVVLRDGMKLDGALIRCIRTQLSRRGSPAHVPDVIAQVQALPITHNGKRSERAAQNAINGVPVRNLEAMANPECLEAIRRHPALCLARSGSSAENIAVQEDAPLEQQLRTLWEWTFQASPIGLDDDFFDLGGHSLLAFMLLLQLRKLTGRELPLSTLLYAPTIRTMAALLRSQRAANFSCLVPIKAQGTGRPLFIVHGIYGNVLDLKRLADLLRSPRPVYAFQARGLEPGMPPHDRVEDMAEEYLSAMRLIQARGPFALAGHSFGGVVAFEMARRLQAQGEEIELLALFDSDVHERCLPLGAWLVFQGQRVARVVRNAARESHGRGWDYLRHVIAIRFLEAIGRRRLPHPFAVQTEQELPAHFRAVQAAGVKAHRRYRPRFYPGPIRFFRADVREPQRCDPLPVWRRVSTAVEVVPLTGEHLTMMHHPHVDLLARQLDKCLEQTPSGAETGQDATEKAVSMLARNEPLTVFQRGLNRLWPAGDLSTRYWRFRARSVRTRLPAASDTGHQSAH